MGQHRWQTIHSNHVVATGKAVTDLASAFPPCQPLTAREGADPFGTQVARRVVGGRVSSP